MNKLARRTLLAAAGLCIAGGILFAVGTGLGGMRFLATADLSTIGSPNSSRKLYEMDKTKLDDFSRLEADITYMDISILPSEDDSCYLSYQITGSGAENPFQYTIQDGTLTLKEDLSAESQFFVGIDYSFLARLFTGRVVTDAPDNVSDNLTLYLPKDKYLDYAAISGGDGDIILHGLQTEQLTLESSYGDLIMSDVNAKSGSLSLGDGDAQMDTVTTGQMDFDTSYGDVSVNHCSLGTVTFQSSDGDFTSENTTYTGNCSFDLSYGSVSFRLDDSQKETLSMDLKTDYGDISVAEDLPNSSYTQYEDEDTKSYRKTGSADAGKVSVYCADGDISIR